MIRKIYPSIFAVLVFLVFFLVASAWAHNKVVVIPLMEDAPPLGPWALVAAESPPNSAYTIGTTTVTDNVTGLVWQKENDDTERTWYDAWDYCTDNTPSLPGTGWRLPTMDELISIVYYGTYDPAINGTAFPGTHSSYYWSATTYANYSGDAWIVGFDYGNVNRVGKSNTYYVRCVR